MSSSIFVLLLLSVFLLRVFAANVTKCDRKEAFLSRTKRYLQWPMGSNFVINFTLCKPLLTSTPSNTFITCYEMDVPFAVSSDYKIFFGKNTKKMKAKRHVLEKNHLVEHLEDFMTMLGLDGSACTNRLICEAQVFITLEKHSLFRDLIKVLFINGTANSSPYEQNCEEQMLEKCSISLLNIFANLSPN